MTRDWNICRLRKIISVLYSSKNAWVRGLTTLPLQLVVVRVVSVGIGFGGGEEEDIGRRGTECLRAYEKVLKASLATDVHYVL